MIDARTMGLAAAMVLLSNIPSGAVTTTLDASADSYLRGGGAENTNEGASTFLRVQRTGNNRALVRFDQATIAGAVSGGTLQAATLRLFIETNNGSWGTGRAIDVHRLLSDWSEPAVTWSCPEDTNLANSSPDCASPWNGGAFNPTAAASYTQSNALTGVVSIDVTAEVAAFLGGAGNFGWLIKKREENQNGVVEYTSREGTAGQQPMLQLDVFIPPTNTPTVTPTATPTATPTGTPTSTFTPSSTPTPNPLCGATPIAACRQSTQAGKSLLLLRAGASEKLQFKWIKGATTAIADFGDPTTAQTYTFCVYDETAGAAALKLQALLPPGGDCAGKPCWKSTGKGFLYKDKNAAADGIQLLNLKSGADGKAKIILKGKGANLHLPALPLAQDHAVIAQLKNNRGPGECWEARFSGVPKKNDASQFKAKGDAPITPVPTPTHTFTPN
jgi:hypothetical protein